jgi:hypothetical protein
MTRRRWSTVAVCIGIVLVMAAAAFRAFAVPALIRFPLNVDETTHYTGIATTYIDESTLLPLVTPKREPVRVDRHTRVVNGDFSKAVIAETITIRTGSTTSVENYQYVMDRRSMQFADDPRQYAFGDPKSIMHAAGGHRVNFAMGTTTDGT